MFAKAHRLDAEMLESARKEFAAMESAGILKILNTLTVSERYPLPNIAYFSARLHSSKVFTKLDLSKGYH